MTSKNGGKKDPLSSSGATKPEDKTPDKKALDVENSPSNHEKRTASQSEPSIGASDVFTKKIESVMRENERLKKQLIHVETLGRLVADCKQSNLRLSKENGELHERLNELVRIQLRNQTLDPIAASNSLPSGVDDKNFYNRDMDADDERTDEAFYASQTDTLSMDTSSGESSTCVMTTSATSTSGPVRISQTGARCNDSIEASTTQAGGLDFPAEEIDARERATTHETGATTTMQVSNPSKGGNEIRPDPVAVAEYEECQNESAAMEATAAAEFCERQAQNSLTLSQEINAFHEVLGSDDPATCAEISQLEYIVGAMDHGESTVDKQLFTSVNEESKLGGSVTAQFAKLANIFARLAQRVMLTQKKARNSQAFCDALLRENDKLKTRLNTANKKVAEMQDQAEPRNSKTDQAHRGVTPKKERAPSRRSSSCTDETAAKESIDVADDELFASITDPALKSFVTKLQSRIRKLEGQRTEILTVNKQWHTQYNKLKDECDAKLNASRVELEDLKEQITGKQQEHAKRRKDINILLHEAKKEIEILQRQKGELARSYAHEHSKVQSMNENTEKLKADMSCIQAENQRLNQALEAAYSIRQNRQLSAINNTLYNDQAFDSAGADLPTSNGGERPHSPEGGQGQAGETAPGHVEDLMTQVEVLQEQVKIYREDFETERRDREKSQAEKQRLTEEMARMRDEMRALNQQVRANEQDFRQERREKQRLQRQLSRIQAPMANDGSPAADDYYYDMRDNVFQPHRVSPGRNRHRFGDPEVSPIRTEIGDRVLQTATAVDHPHRYAGRARVNPPPPYTQESARLRRRPAPTAARRIRGGYLEPVGYNQDLDVVYPPEQ